MDGMQAKLIHQRIQSYVYRAQLTNRERWGKMEREGGREGVCNIPENDGFKHDLVKKIVIIFTNILNAI